VRLRKNATLGGTPSYTDINTSDSVVDYDVAGTTASAGTLWKSLKLGKTESKDIDLSSLEIELFPSETLTISAFTDSGTSDIGVSLTWKESL